MKKSLFCISIAALLFGAVNVNLNNRKSSNEFIDNGFDAINEVAKPTRLNALGASGEKNGANKEAGNAATYESSKMGVQSGKNSKGQTCMRFAVAIPSLNVNVVFDRTLTLTNGDVSYGQVKATSAYSSLIGGDDIIVPSSWNNQCNEADYNYFVVYTMSGIPESEYGAKIEVSATITALPETNEEESSEPVANAAPKEDVVVEVYNSANIYGLEGTSPEGTKPVTDAKTNADGTLEAGQTIIDPVTSSQYIVVVDDETGEISLSASQGKAGNDGSVTVSSVYVKVGNEIVEFPVTEISTGFASGLTNSTTVINLPNTIKSIGTEAFKGLNKIDVINFDGTAEEWNKIEIDPNAFHSNLQNKDKIRVICNDGKSYVLEVKTGKIDVNSGVKVNVTINK